MVSLILELVLQKLRDAGFPADMAYPGRMIPRISETVAAAHIKQVVGTGMMVTVEVSIISPEYLGGTACELEALRAMEVLCQTGAVCTLHGCVYDGRGQVYTASILAEYACLAGERSYSLGPGVQVFIGDERMLYTVAFTAAKESNHRAVYQMGEGGPGDPVLGSWLWKLELEELLPAGTPGTLRPQDGCTLRLRGLTGEEVFSGCCWTSVRSEYTAKGLRRIFRGFALDREEKTWTS